HFEKMLYDNAQLARLYARAAVTYDDDFYESVARDVFAYVEREMTDAESGVFYSAQDAEVSAREGLNYLWTREQFDEVLGAEDAAFAASIYGVDQGHNFQDPRHPAEPAANVLTLRARPVVLAEEAGVPLAEFAARKKAIDARLYRVRAKREQPRLDDKVLTGWNGLMIAAYADSARMLEDPALLATARRAADFLLERMRGEDGDLLRAWREGEARIPGFLEDYALLMQGLLAIHEAGEAMGERDLGYLDAARELGERAEALFADPQVAGVWYDTRRSRADLLVRTRALNDGASPSGPSTMANNWLTLQEITGDRRYLRRAVDMVGAASGMLARQEWPVAMLGMSRALHRMLQMDEALVSEFAATGPAGNADATAEAPVEVWSDVDRVAVSSEAPGTVRLQLRVGGDYHINAHEPGVDMMVPLSVSVINGTGVRAVVEYPQGEALGASNLGAEFEVLRVHRGKVELTVRLERTDDAWTGRPLLALTYQACTDVMCLEPTTVELDVAIDPR
ncbi:MAG: hypothetical protein KDA21_01655, partial [Phycisphaerales bacterium]|nr:hypothetical protein [Phycisphaerales bacterium]